MGIQPNQPQSIGGVLDTAFQLYKVALPRVLPMCGLAALGDIPLSIYSASWTARVAGSTDFGEMASLMGRMFADPLYWSLGLLNWVLKVWLLSALLLQVNALGSDQQLQTADALRRAARPMASLFLVSLLYGIIVALGFIVVVPGMIFAVSLLFALPLILLEAKGPMSSLQASHRLVWGCWWRTSAILTVGSMIVMVIFIALGLVVGVLDPLISVGSSPMYEVMSTVVVGIVSSVAMSPLYCAFVLATYWDLKLRKHGGDLAARVGELSAGA